MDNLATTYTLAPDALQKYPPPRHLTLSPLSLHQLKELRAGSSLAQEILWIMILSLLHPRVKENAMMTVCFPVLLLFDMNQLYPKDGLERKLLIRWLTTRQVHLRVALQSQHEVLLQATRAESHLYMLPSRKARRCQSMIIQRFVLISLEIKKQSNKKDRS